MGLKMDLNMLSIFGISVFDLSPAVKKFLEFKKLEVLFIYRVKKTKGIKNGK